MPNFSSVIFSNSQDIDLSNSYESLDSIDKSSPPKPISTSTPIKPTKRTVHGLNTLLVNFQSIFEKRAEFSNFVHEAKCDIIIGTETWLKPEIQTSELLLNDFDIFRKDRETRGGGVLLAVKKSLCAEEIKLSSDTESVFCKIKLKGRKSVVFGSVYRPTNNDISYSSKLVNDLYNLYSKNKSSIFWLGGDFNLPDINWKTNEIVGNQYPYQLNLLFLDMAQDLCFDQLVDKPTRGKSILDLIFTYRPDIAKNFFSFIWHCRPSFCFSYNFNPSIQKKTL